MRDWLVSIRRGKGFTQEQVALQSFIDRGYYSQIEKGKRNPSPDVARKIAEVLGFNPSAFFLNYISEPFHLALRDVPIFLAHCDLDLRYTWVFNSLCNDEVIYIGKRDDEIALNKGTLELMEFKKQVLIEQKPSRKKINLICSGRSIVVEVFGQPILDEECTVLGISTAAVNITELI